MGWLVFVMQVLANTGEEQEPLVSVAVGEKGVSPAPTLFPDDQALSIDEILRKEADGIRWCYKDEMAQLPPSVDAVTIVHIAIDGDGRMSVMAHDETLSTVGSDKSDACLGRYLKKYRAGRVERNMMLVKKAITIAREVKELNN